MVSSNASLSYAEIAAARVKEDQPLFFQFYKHKDDDKALERVREAERLGYNAIFLTVDAVVAGFRERDVKAPFVLEEEEREAEKASGKEVPMPDAPQDGNDEGGGEGLGTAGALIGDNDRDMSWEKVSTGSGCSVYIPLKNCVPCSDNTLVKKRYEVTSSHQRCDHLFQR